MNKLLRYLLLPCIALLYAAPSFSQQTVGLFLHGPTTYDNGYVLFNALNDSTTYLIDKCGKKVHKWQRPYLPGNTVYLLPDGNLLRTAEAPGNKFHVGGEGGLIEKIDWNGNVLWSYTISSDTELQHHDIEPLPSGNILVISFDVMDSVDAVAAGRDPAKLGKKLWSEKILELQPIGADSAAVVWQWRIRDHLVQHFDKNMPNYGVISDHPELIDLNYTGSSPADPDWHHMNGIDYNPALDQIMVTSHRFNELWIIDHSTTTQEAASHSGGNSGKGGDLLYRWGNPETYERGNINDRKLFRPHDAHWIESGMRFGNHIMVFNNGNGRPAGAYSSVDIIEPPVHPSGAYNILPAQPYGPDDALWSYLDSPDFYSPGLSGAQMLANGHMLICEGDNGRLFEIDSNKNMVWEYVNPVNNAGPITQGAAPGANQVFRAAFYHYTYSAFSGKTLVADQPIELNPLPYQCDANFPVSVSQAAQQADIQVYPNPFNNNINISLPAGARQVQLYATDGRLVWQQEVKGKNSIQATVPANLASGLYYLRVQTQEGSMSKVLVKE